MMTLNSFKRLIKYSKPTQLKDVRDKACYYEKPRLSINPNQIELVRVEEGDGNWHNEVIVHNNSDYKIN